MHKFTQHGVNAKGEPVEVTWDPAAFEHKRRRALIAKLPREQQYALRQHHATAAGYEGPEEATQLDYGSAFNAKTLAVMAGIFGAAALVGYLWKESNKKVSPPMLRLVPPETLPHWTMT